MRRLLPTTALALTLVLSATGTSRAADKPMTKTAIDLKKLLPQWAAKAKKSLKDLGVYPLPKTDLYAEHMGRVDDQVIPMLADVLDKKDSEMDAYMKLQLLAFKPNLEKAEVKDLMKIIAAMPKIKEIPPPPRKMMKYFEEGTKDQRVAKKIEPLIEKYQGMTQAKNAKNFEYRNAIIGLLPQTGGLRLYASLQDMTDRYMANSPSSKSKEVRDRTKDEAHYFWDNKKPLPKGMQDTLMKMLDKLRADNKNDLYRNRVTNVSIDKTNGKVKIDKIWMVLDGNNEQRYTDLKQFITTVKLE